MRCLACDENRELRARFEVKEACRIAVVRVRTIPTLVFARYASTHARNCNQAQSLLHRYIAATLHAIHTRFAGNLTSGPPRPRLDV